MYICMYIYIYICTTLPHSCGALQTLFFFFVFLFLFLLSSCSSVVLEFFSVPSFRVNFFFPNFLLNCLAYFLAGENSISGIENSET